MFTIFSCDNFLAGDWICHIAEWLHDFLDRVCDELGEALGKFTNQHNIAGFADLRWIVDPVDAFVFKVLKC